jgi:hypothetical protein
MLSCMSAACLSEGRPPRRDSLQVLPAADAGVLVVFTESPDFYFKLNVAFSLNQGEYYPVRAANTAYFKVVAAAVVMNNKKSSWRVSFDIYIWS